MMIVSLRSASRHRRFVIASIALLICAGVAVAVAGALNTEGKISNAKAVVAGGTPEQQALAQDIVSGITAVAIPRVEIGEPPDGFAADPALNELGTTWISVYVQVPGLENGGSVIGQWASQLIAGAFRDQSHARNMPDLLGSSVIFELPDKTTEFGGGGVIATQFNLPVDEADTAIIGQRLRDRIRDLRGLQESSVSFQRPDNLAPVITETTDDAAAFIQANGPSLLQASIGDLNQLEGSLLVVKDGAGKVVRLSAYAARTGMGATWTRPGLPPEGVTAGGHADK